MDRSVSKKTWQAIYRLLDMVQPVDYDCGTLCGAACCTFGGGGDEMGIYLMPGEEAMFTDDEGRPNTDWLEWTVLDPSECGFPESWPGPVYYCRCRPAPQCHRSLRPLQCRVFPVKPYINESGLLELIWDYNDLPYTCPLIESNAEISEDFFKATYTVWSHLLNCEGIYDLVAEDSEALRE